MGPKKKKRRNKWDSRGVTWDTQEKTMRNRVTSHFSMTLWGKAFLKCDEARGKPTLSTQSPV